MTMYQKKYVRQNIYNMKDTVGLKEIGKKDKCTSFYHENLWEKKISQK